MRRRSREEPILRLVVGHVILVFILILVVPFVMALILNQVTSNNHKTSASYEVVLHQGKPEKSTPPTSYRQVKNLYIEKAKENQILESILSKEDTLTVEATAYCLCPICCGVWSAEHPDNIGNPDFVQLTATGTTPTPGRTIAVDPKVIPYGSEVIINDYLYIAEDTGGAIQGARIDILFSSHEEALEWGRQKVVARW